METIVRHWHILRMIPGRGKTDAGTIHKKLQALAPGDMVSRRTIERDLHKLIDSSFPLECDGNKPQGWSWQPQAGGLNVPGMDLTTALTFRMADEYLKRLLPTSYAATLTPHVTQANNLLNTMEDDLIADWPDKIRVVPRTQPLLPPTVCADVVDVVYDSLFRNKRFEVSYQAVGGQNKRYELNPLGLIFSDPVVYLAATCWDYDDTRLFALHRMSDAAGLDKDAAEIEGFDLQEYIDGGALGFGQELDKKIRLKALFTRGAAQHLRESPLCENQKITDRKDGRVLIEAEVADTAQLRWWLLGFGSQVEVLSPKKHREEMIETCRSMAKNYNLEADHA